jgi:hypothetical protein
MSLTAQSLIDRFQAQIAPDDTEEFLRILTEADSRLLSAGRWAWTRSQLTLTPDEDRMVALPPEYESIVACRIESLPIGVTWQETEFLPEGPGVIPITGYRGRLVDQGITTTLGDDDSDDVNERFYKLCDASVEEIYVLARYAPVPPLSDPTERVHCPSMTALKQMMLAVIYEEANNIKASMEYRALAIQTLTEEEASYRGSAKEVYKPKPGMRLRRRARINFP